MKRRSFLGRFLYSLRAAEHAFRQSWKSGSPHGRDPLHPESADPQISHPAVVPEIELYFPRFENEESMSESEICIMCHGCCSYVTADLEEPVTRQRIEEYRWYLFHRNTEIFIDNDGNWQLLFKTPCNELDEKGYCKVYDKRPQICRDYSADSCSRTGKDHTHLFKTPEDLLMYLNASKRKKSGKGNLVKK